MQTDYFFVVFLQVVSDRVPPLNVEGIMQQVAKLLGRPVRHEVVTEAPEPGFFALVALGPRTSFALGGREHKYFHGEEQAVRSLVEAVRANA